MGHRANLVIAEKDQYHLFYCHWCTNTLPRDIFWGLEWTLNFISQQKPVTQDENGWLDEIWAEGGVIVDIQNHHLMLWGGETIHYEIPLRRLYLDLLQEVWQGWTVRWASNRIYEMADYLGVERTIVMSGKIEDKDGIINLTLPDKLESIRTIATIRWNQNDLLILPTNHDLTVLYFGDELLLKAKPLPLSSHRKTFVVKGEFPYYGFHIDLETQSIVIWGRYMPNLEVIQQAWQGWTIHWMEDDYQLHITLTKGSLIWEIPDKEALLSQLEKEMVESSSLSHTNYIQEIAQQFEREGKTVTVNPNALVENPQTVPDETRLVIWNKAVAAWRAKQE